MNKHKFTTVNLDRKIVEDVAATSGLDVHVLRTALHIALLNEPVGNACVREKLDVEKFTLQLLKANWMLDETVRWRETQRDQRLFTVTGVVDVTLVPTRWKDPLLWSAKHKRHGWKFQVTVTPQAVPICVYGPFPGRWHDMKCFQPALKHHCSNDAILADLGYLGAVNHVFVPNKKPPRGELTEEQLRQNAVIGRVRARVEHFFSLLKNWALVRDGPRVRNPNVIRALFTVAVVYEHHRMLSLHPRYPCSDVPLQPGQPCLCTMKKRAREEPDNE